MPEPAVVPSRAFLQGPRPLAFAHRGGSLLWPDLEEVVEAFPEVRINVEIKQESPPAVQAVADFIERRGQSTPRQTSSGHDGMEEQDDRH